MLVDGNLLGSSFSGLCVCLYGRKDMRFIASPAFSVWPPEHMLALYRHLKARSSVEGNREVEEVRSLSKKSLGR